MSADFYNRILIIYFLLRIKTSAQTKHHKNKKYLSRNNIIYNIDEVEACK